jgi:hypothetical protein
LQLSTLGCESLKSQSFLSVHIHQHMIIIISIVKGTMSSLLICLVALAGFNHVATLTPICLQQFLAKEHLKKGALIFPLFAEYTSHNQESNCIFSLFNKFLVLSLFLSNSKEKSCVSVGRQNTKFI